MIVRLNIYKQHIDDWIFCPYYYAKNLLANRSNIEKLDGDYLKFKQYVTSIASYEMKNNSKVDLKDYRIGYTNKFYGKKRDLFDPNSDSIIFKLNSLFSIFSENIFLGYNVPVEIAIPGTSIIYKSLINYIMTDCSSDKIIAIEIMPLGDATSIKRKIKNWPHYYTIYSYLAAKFNKKVELIIIDPILNTKLEFVFLPQRYKHDIKLLSDILVPVEKNILYYNLYNCNKECSFIGECNAQ